MSYPPGNPGYPPPAPTTQFAAPTQQFARPTDPAPAGPSKLPFYLSIAVAVFGLAVYLSNFGPLFTISNSEFPQLGTASGTTPGLNNAVIASVLAGLVAAVALLPKQKALHGWITVISTLSFLLVLAEVFKAPAEVSVGWALYLVIVFTFLQAGAAVCNLLLDAGIITAPEPKQRYDAPYGGYAPQQQYYGQPGQSGQPGQPGQHQPGQHQGAQQRPGYGQPQQGQPQQGQPQQYGGYGAASGSPYGAQSGHTGPPTPPTGFPAYGQPQPPGSSEDTGPQATAAPQQSAPTQQTQQSAPSQTTPGQS